MKRRKLVNLQSHNRKLCPACVANKTHSTTKQLLKTKVREH